MKKVFYVSFILSLFFIACNNDDDSSEDQEVVENYYALKIGNTWSYEYFKRVAQTEEFETMGIVEEVEITETTIIDGETYFVFQSNTTGNDNDSPFAPENGITTINIRDSLGYLLALDQDFHILFSNENTEDYLLSDNDWGDVFGVLLDETESITVEAGVFICNENEIYAIIENSGAISPGRSRRYYFDGIGEIYWQISIVSEAQHIWEKRLIEFDVID